MSKVMKYVDAIQKTDKEKGEALAPARADEQKGVLGLEIAKLRVEIASLNNAVAEEKGRYPINTGRLIDALNQVALAERRLEQLTAVVAELF